jgi:hypothetical protein
MPLRFRNDLPENVRSCLGAFIALDLAPLEKAVTKLVVIEARQTDLVGSYKMRDSIEASRGWLLNDLIRLSKLGTWLACEGAMVFGIICGWAEEESRTAELLEVNDPTSGDKAGRYEKLEIITGIADSRCLYNFTLKIDAF